MHVSLRVGQCCIMAIELMINFVLIKGPAGLFSGLDWASFQQARKILKGPWPAPVQCNRVHCD